MCGIVGFTGRQQAAPVLLAGLSKLEYRGYDSSGLAVRDGESQAEVVKATGKLRNLAEKAMVPFDKALYACTVNPAALLGLDDHLGRIAVGYDADLVVLADDYSVEETWCKGIAQLH